MFAEASNKVKVDIEFVNLKVINLLMIFLESHLHNQKRKKINRVYNRTKIDRRVNELIDVSQKKQNEFIFLKD